MGCGRPRSLNDIRPQEYTRLGAPTSSTNRPKSRPPAPPAPQHRARSCKHDRYFCKKEDFPALSPRRMRTPGVVLEIDATQSRACASGKQPAKKLSMLARRLFVLAALATAICMAICMACSDDGTTPGTPAPTRSYR